MQHLSILRRREYPEVRETGANIPLAPGRGMLHDLAEVLAFPPHLTHDLILFLSEMVLLNAEPRRAQLNR